MSGPEDITAALASVAADTYAEPDPVPAPSEPEPDPVPAEPAPEEGTVRQGPFTISAPAAQMRWVLQGADVSTMQMLPAWFAYAGASVEVIEPGRSYRMHANNQWLKEAAAVFAAKLPGVTLQPERADPNRSTIVSCVDLGRAWRRTQFIQGPDVHPLVTRAIDMRLRVAAAGLQRWSVTGPAMRQAQWVAEVSRMTFADVLATWGTSQEALTREDQAEPTITVELPDREITTDLIDRDADGRLRRVVQIETTRR